MKVNRMDLNKVSINRVQLNTVGTVISSKGDNTPEGNITDALLMEDGSLFLMENGSFFSLEKSAKTKAKECLK